MADADLWPPKPFDIAFSKFTEHDAWYRGDTARLQQLYTGQIQNTYQRGGSTYQGGIVGRLSKMFWGTPVPNDEHRAKMHSGLAAGICQLSADLLYGEPPKFRYSRPDDFVAETGADGRPKKWQHPGQVRLNAIMGSDESHAELLKAGEYAAALGGAYLSVVWDAALADHVWFRAYSSDCAVPVFKYGKLVGCTLWSEFRPELASEVYRLLEVHSIGYVSYTLYRGTEKTLGTVVPLSTLTETTHYEYLRTEAELEAALADPGTLNPVVSVATGVDALAVVYIPNRMPQREWRKLGELANLGRSDLDGIEDQLDKVDKVWSSLIRDVDNGAGRLTVPESWLEQGKRGEGATFDPDRQMYVGVSTLGSPSDGVKDQVHLSQFEIRDEAHANVLDSLKREIAYLTGYSEAHMGVRDAAEGQRTATEVTADFTDSERTRDKKAILAKPELARLAQVALAIDGVVFPGKGGKWFDERPDVEFAPVSQQDMEKAARIISALFLADAITLRERVKMAHPEWDDEQIDSQAEELRKELEERAGAAAPDPATFRGDDVPPRGQAGEPDPARNKPGALTGR